MEVTTGLDNFYLVDISNFFVIVNSATNCFIFLKVGFHKIRREGYGMSNACWMINYYWCIQASQWLSNRYVERKTMKRKRTVCDIRQMLGDARLKLLESSWKNALNMTNGQLGLRVLYSMLRKHPQLFSAFRPQQQVQSIENGIE